MYCCAITGVVISLNSHIRCTNEVGESCVAPGLKLLTDFIPPVNWVYSLQLRSSPLSPTLTAAWSTNIALHTCSLDGALQYRCASQRRCVCEWNKRRCVGKQARRARSTVSTKSRSSNCPRATSSPFSAGVGRRANNSPRSPHRESADRRNMQVFVVLFIGPPG